MSHKLKIKQVDLSGVTQDNAKTRFLVIDSNGNLSWSNDVSGGGASITYTNLTPIQSALGGITVGQTFNGATMQQMWDYLLYPYLNPAFSSFGVSGASVLEVGDALPTSLTFSWNSTQDSNVSPNSIVITDTTGTLLTGQPADGSNSHTYGSAVSLNTYGSYTWSISGTNTLNGTYASSLTKYWFWKVYWGTSSSTSTPTASFVKNLTNGQLLGGKAGTYSFSANDYKYLAIPASYGVPGSIYYNGLPFALADSGDGYSSGGGNITYLPISITNDFGQTTTYNVFRSKNPLVGAVSMIVS